MEVRDMMALLNLLDNRRQDIPLAALLRCPLGRLDEPETSLARIRAAYPEDVPFFDAAFRYKDEKDDVLAGQLQVFFESLQQWRQAAQRRPLADVLWDIYHQSGYLAYVSGLSNRRAARGKSVASLHERAAQFDGFQSRGLSRFLRFLEQLRDGSDIGQPSIASAADNAVRIMSVHGAKGLEYPVVVVPDLGKMINMQDCQGAILADRKAGLGMVVIDEEKRCRYPSLVSTLVQNRLRQQSLAEELRVLYVAMTRAREHLILVGTCPPRPRRKNVGLALERGHRRSAADGCDPRRCKTDAGLDRPRLGDDDGSGTGGVSRQRLHAGASGRMARAGRGEPSANDAFRANCDGEANAVDSRAAAFGIREGNDRSCRVHLQMAGIWARSRLAIRDRQESSGICRRVAEPAARRRSSLQRLLPAAKFHRTEPLDFSHADRGTATHVVLQHLNFTTAHATARTWPLRSQHAGRTAHPDRRAGESG